MIEVPRAAIRSGHIARYADFFSFGTNDLTQMTFAFSRDDVASFLPTYLEKHVLDVDPFKSIDEDGVGDLIRYAIGEGRTVKPDLKIGICGEHGGDPVTIDFCYRAGLSYVSCSPFRVPLARLAGAQAVINNSKVSAGEKKAGFMGDSAEKPVGRKAAANKPAEKKTADKKTAAKPAAKKPVGRPPAVKKTADKKTTAKPAGRKAAEKKAAVKPAAKKPVGRPLAAKKAAEKKAAVKPAAKKPVGRPPAAKKPAGRKAAEKKTTAKPAGIQIRPPAKWTDK
jgi:pyruvate,orthophosphate dikinase